MAYFQILGTGPSTPITEGTGRNRRRRSSGLMQNISSYVLIDATHDFEEQAAIALSVTAVVVTSASRDAAGGLSALDKWADLPVELLAPPSLFEEISTRYGNFENINHVPITPLHPHKTGDLNVTAFEVHAGTGEDGRESYGYRFETGKRTVTYVSDFKDLPEGSERFLTDNELLIVDGGGWDRDLPTHRGVLNRLPSYADANNAMVLFTGIGRSAPPHAQASTAVKRVCHRADVAYDFMKIPLGR